MLKFIVLTIISVLGVISCSSNSQKKVDFFSDDGIAHKQIILYMKDSEDTGQVITSRSDADYYRVLLKNKEDKFLVQDFYISGNKQTDPYWLVNGEKDYVYNENQSNKYYPRDGSRIIWYNSGAKLAETNYKNDKEDGKWITWYENGQKKEEVFYSEGLINGTTKNWSEDGVLLGECIYKLGRENGRCYEKYSVNPEVMIYDGQYKLGEKIGHWREWDINGKLEKVEDFN